MDRNNDVKILLKNWEQKFLKEHKRKPNKVESYEPHINMTGESAYVVSRQHVMLL